MNIKIKQAKWLLEHEKDLVHISSCCPPFETIDGKYCAGCKFCIVQPFTQKNGTCPVDIKIMAATETLKTLRKEKLERIEIINRSFYDNCHVVDEFSIFRTYDSFNNGLLTKFDIENLPIYEEALRIYPKTKEQGLFLRIENNNNDRVGSMWFGVDCDLSNFWKIHNSVSEKYDKMNLRIKKINRVLND